MKKSSTKKVSTKKRVSTKKVSTKKGASTRKKASTKKRVTPTIGGTYKLPPGFEVVEMEEEYAAAHDFDITPEIMGSYVDVKEVPKSGKMKKDTRVLILRTEEGLKSVWESAALVAHFDDLKETATEKTFLYIRHVGLVPVKGRKTGMRTFVIARKN